MVTIRLQRRGRRKRPIHHIVVADSRSPRDGRIVEDLGRFNNITPKNEVKLDEERAIYWLKEGAKPSDTVRSILKKQGVMYKMHLMRWGKSDEEIEAALTEWREKREEKEDKIPSKQEQQQAMLDAEEKEYQKQLKQKAEEAAKEKAKQQALAAEEEKEAKAEAEEADNEQQAEAEEKEKDQVEVKAEDSDEEPSAKETKKEEESVETEDNAKVEASEDTAAEEEPEKEETEAKTAEDPDEEEAKAESGQVSTDMLAKEAIAHIENTPVDELQDFVSDDEDRVTVQRAMKEKQEE